MISVRVTGPVFRIIGADEAMILVTCARWEIFVMIPANAIPGGGACSAKFISLKHKYHILLTNNLHGEIL